MTNEVDVRENDILKIDGDLLSLLLFDHTTRKNIFWATDNYANLGKGFQSGDEILIENVTGEYGDVVKPRVKKSKKEQMSRVRDKAEVFTPSWICNSQNNLIDEAWFKRKNVFNTEIIDEDGNPSWIVNTDKIIFPDGKTWQSYVCENRLEITCGEAPYIVSRYDTTTGKRIPIERRIGLLDRKIRVINENVDDTGKWLEAVQDAYKSTYAFEWQGDNLLLAREAMMFTFIDYYKYKFGKKPLVKSMKYIAYIVSWNVWQMDGLKGVVPNSCNNNVEITENTFFGKEKVMTYCNGCQNDNIRTHNGTYCLIKDWKAKDSQTGCKGKKTRYIDLIK
ncbi:MAG: restriction endonuclease subunit M [Prevotella sp.]|nr:restriction endonuclease subunit M [Prevotella sp.]